jgi:hypothetical protein
LESNSLRFSLNLAFLTIWCISFFLKINMKLFVVNFYAPLLGYIISDCSSCCEKYKSTKYKLPVLRVKAMTVWTKRLWVHPGPHITTQCFISYFY